MNNRRIGLLGGMFAIVFIGLFLIQGCGRDSNPKFQTEYQAVVLMNGQYFFGKAEFWGKEYVRLKNVFYLYPHIDQKTNQRMNTLVKKGSEFHGADEMYINTEHIIAIEPVSPESPLGKLIIKDANSQKINKKK